MVRIISMASSIRPSLSTFRFSSSSRFGLPLSSFTPSRNLVFSPLASGIRFLYVLAFIFSIMFFFFIILLVSSAELRARIVFIFEFNCYLFIIQLSRSRNYSVWELLSPWEEMWTAQGWRRRLGMQRRQARVLLMKVPWSGSRKTKEECFMLFIVLEIWTGRLSVYMFCFFHLIKPALFLFSFFFFLSVNSCISCWWWQILHWVPRDEVAP